MSKTGEWRRRTAAANWGRMMPTISARLRDGYTLEEIANILNAKGHRNFRGNPITKQTLSAAVRQHLHPYRVSQRNYRRLEHRHNDHS